MTSQQDKHDDSPPSDARSVLYKKDFWQTENLQYSRPHRRMEKVARTVNSAARRKDLTLLDVGCGPATLATLLQPNIHYYGVDIAIQKPAPNLLEADLMETPIGFGARRFDFVVAQGFFEYAGQVQSKKLAEIAGLLADGGTFIASYVNFDHRDRYIYKPYSNVQPFARFRASVAEHFMVRRVFPTSYNWRHHESEHKIVRAFGLDTDRNIPVLGPVLAVQYILVCTGRRSTAPVSGPRRNA